MTTPKVTNRTAEVRASERPQAQAPERESYPLSIGPADHLETQMVAHHTHDDASTPVTET